MSDVFVCGPGEVYGDTCPSCGGWVHAVRPGGFTGPNGWTFCDEDCVADHVQAHREGTAAHHLHLRDLMCGCAEFCAPAGLPNAAMRAEYEAYRAALDGS